MSKSDWTKLNSYMLFIGINLTAVFNLKILKVHSGEPHPHNDSLNCMGLFYEQKVREYINVLLK